MAQTTTLKAFRIPSRLADNLSRLSAKTHRTETYYLNQALEQYLEDLALVGIASDRLADSKGTLTLDELKGALGV